MDETNRAARVGCLVALALMWVAGSGQAAADEAVGHPLDPLSPEEVAATVELLRDAGHVSADTRFQTITLEEPAKAEVLAWHSGEEVRRASYVVARDGGGFYQGVVDLSERRVRSWEAIEGAQPGILLDEWEAAQAVTVADPSWQEAMRRRGFTHFDDVLCAPLSVGNLTRPEERGKRLLGVPCFSLEGSKNNLFARPIGGLAAIVDLGARRVVRLIDTGAVALPASSYNYDPESVGAAGPAARPVDIAAPAGANFRVDGHVVSWRPWRFHLRMDQRSGLVISLATFRDGEEARSVLYQGSLSEIFVPYMDPAADWTWRTFLDAGEYGLGLLASPLRAGIDCPSSAAFFDASIVMPSGEAARSEDVVCLFERPTGAPLWRHGEAINGTYEGRPRTDLVARTIAQVGNYDYLVDWVFGLDGTLRIDVGATGIDIVKAADAKTLSDPPAAAETAHGTLVAPNLVAPNHDHYVAFRLDLDVDGRANSFVPGRFATRRLPASAEGDGRRSVWVRDAETVAHRESEARMRIDLEHPALWQVVNPARHNARGYPTSYTVAVEGPIVPLGRR